MKTATFKNLKKSDRIKIEEELQLQELYNKFSYEFFKSFKYNKGI